MLSGQRIASVRVVELGRVFPVGGVVARLAIVTELSLMEILVAAKAVRGKTQERLAGIFVLDQLLHLHAHVRRGVALPAAECGMLAVQGVAGLVVIKLFLRWLPANQLKAFTVVLGVAAGAVFVGIVFLHHGGVKAFVLHQPLVDLGVAIQAFQRTPRSEPMAAGALRQSGDGLMCFGEWAGRDLRADGARHAERNQKAGDRKRESGPRPGAMPQTSPPFLCRRLLAHASELAPDQHFKAGFRLLILGLRDLAFHALSLKLEQFVF